MALYSKIIWTLPHEKFLKTPLVTPSKIFVPLYVKISTRASDKIKIIHKNVLHTACTLSFWRSVRPRFLSIASGSTATWSPGQFVIVVIPN